MPLVLIILGALWVYWARGDMLDIIVSSSLFGKRSAARVMTFCSIYFLPNDKFTGFGPPEFEIISKSIDLDVQILDLEFPSQGLTIQIYDF